MYEYIYVCHEQNARQNHNTNTDNKHLKNMAKFKYFGIIPTNQNRIHKEINPLPSLTLQSTWDLYVSCRPKCSKALRIYMSHAGLNVLKRSGFICPMPA
jgi:hypothetical protein